MPNPTPASDLAPQLVGDFEKDVPLHLQDDIITRICEAGWNITKDPDIEIIDSEKRNALNIEFNGTIMIDGVEHTFHIRDGDWNGTEIVSWNGPMAISRHEPVIRALVPHRNRVHDAISQGRAAEFLEEWERDMDPATERGVIIAPLVSAYAYDAYFAPGTGAARSHEKKASGFGYEIADQDEAISARKLLLEAAICLRPVGIWPADTPAAAKEIYQAWLKQGDAGEKILEVLDRTIARLSKTGGMRIAFDEMQELQSLGFTVASRQQERRMWQNGLQSIFEITDLEGFDAATLPEDPIKSLFQVLDPALVSDTRVSPQLEAAKLIDAVTSRMAREKTFQISDSDRQAFAKVGFVLGEKEPACWIVDENDDDIAIYNGPNGLRGTDSRSYRIAEDRVLCPRYDIDEGREEILGEFDRHDGPFSSRSEIEVDPSP